MQQPNYSISTPENVDLHLELAGIGNRVLAALIDTGITYGVLLIVGAIAWGSITYLNTTDIGDGERSIAIGAISMVCIFIAFIVMFGYFIFFEGTWHGQTPGKRLVSIRVIEANGQPVGWGGVVLRNLIRTLDTGLAFIGLIPMVIDKNEKRFGDYAAGTIVVRERKPELLTQELTLSTKYDTDGIDVGRLNPQEYALVVGFLRRREKLNSANRVQVAEELSAYLKDKLGDTSNEPAENFVERVYSAYQARAES
ncbi:MAG TPA: RDD family protein [Drouetiella sp.]